MWLEGDLQQNVVSSNYTEYNAKMQCPGFFVFVSAYYRSRYEPPRSDVNLSKCSFKNLKLFFKN